ncbi:bifunctional 5,10-methylenetetrahydrofolate dehydrogenase/5,10-methenyltetrahydrofolate cyclohydrolase [Candidatus Gracilibacteria bacterium]|nr:bifunctional 5,10-methylenetetrahydrofolate dehydrogenase/5,10-methenyltetrahydrofolate cyclohydrolase [Candidatus Gracilibacteria bacterium]
MLAQIISGRELAKQIIKNDLIPRVELLNKKSVQPKLIVVFVGEHPASQSYIRQKEKFATEAGVLSEVRRFPSTITEKELLEEIERINADNNIHGVIVQLPLPDHIDSTNIIESINPHKDVDGFTNANNLGLDTRESDLPPCTPQGIIRMLELSGVQINGKNAVVMGRSRIVGRPVKEMLMFRGAHVTVLHSQSTNEERMKALQNADILVVAVGKPEFLHGEDLKPGVVIIDVGIHRRENGTLCGDVHFDSAKEVASKISPVPGGVGPMTVVSLIENTIKAAEKL